VTEPGEYYVSVNNGVCIESDSIVIGHYQIPNIDLGSDTLICENSVIEIGLSVLNTTFMWNDGSQEANLIVDSPGEYFVQVEFLETGCRNSDTITIGHLPLPSLYLGEDTTICSDPGFEIHAIPSHADSIVWNDGSTETIYTPLYSSSYFANAYNQCGETRADIIIELLDCSCTLYIPNSFTPNSDGINDYIGTTLNNCDIIEYKFTIYDRWGQEVFSSNDQTEAWNGNQLFENDYYSQGQVYVWKLNIEVDSINGIQTIQEIGHVLLIR